MKLSILLTVHGGRQEVSDFLTRLQEVFGDEVRVMTPQSISDFMRPKITSHPVAQRVQPRQNFETMTVGELGLSVRTVNALRNNGINRVAELCRLSPRKLFGTIRGVGHVTVKKIIQRLAEQGWRLQFDDDLSEAKKAMLLSEFNFPKQFRHRIVNLFGKMGVKTVGELVSHTPAELLAYKNFGNLSFQTLVGVMRELEVLPQSWRDYRGD